MFVRVKRISGKEYAYQVENAWTPAGPRQRVAGYLGRVVRPAVASSERAPLADGSFAELVRAIAARELVAHGFSPEAGMLRAGDVSVALSLRMVRDGDNACAIAMHEGFLCDATLNRLLTLKPSGKQDADMAALVTALLEAGLRADGDELATLFAAWRR